MKPGGQFFFSVWDRIEENEFADVVIQSLASFFPQDPPRFLARTPHGYCDKNRIREELKAGGFSAVSIETVDARSKASSPREVAIAFARELHSETRSKPAAVRLWKTPLNTRQRP